MAETLVKRLDSAHMKHLYEKALETTDADFLSSTAEVTLEQVRRLRLDCESKEKMPPKMQNRPPQPPKHDIQPSFALNSVDILLDGEDAESWLVATPFAKEPGPQCLASSGYEEKKEVVGSPVESSISSELSRGSCPTPASILDAKLPLSQKGSDTLDGFRIARPKSVDLGKHAVAYQKERDIRNLPRNTGCVTHTPAPPVETITTTTTTLRPPKSVVKTKQQADVAEDSERITTLKKSLSSKLRGRITSIGQKDATKTSSVVTKERPKSIGPVRRNRLSMSTQVPRPKSSLGRAASEVAKSVPKRSGLRKKSSPSPHPSSLARPASSLATVREEGREGKRLLGHHKTSPAPRPKSSLGRPKDERKTVERMGISRIASPAPRPKSAISGLKKTMDQSTSTKKQTTISRITRPASLAKSTPENKESRTLLGFKRSTASLSLAPKSTPTLTKGESRLRRKAVGQ